MSQCNLCVVRDIRRRARNQRPKLKVTVQGSGDDGLDGFDVFVHPADTEPTQEHKKAWLMGLSEACVCHE